MSLQEVVRTVHMQLDLARLEHQVVDVLITDLAKFLDVIAQNVHPILGAQVGLGELTTSSPILRASRIPCPWAPGSRVLRRSSWVPPRALSRGSMRAQRRLSHFYA